MKIDWKSPGLTWAEHAAENAAIMAAGAALAVISPGDQLHIAWATVAAVAGKAALIALLTAVVALGQSNGTASFNARVAARKRVARKTTNVKKPAPVPQAPTTADLYKPQK